MTAAEDIARVADARPLVVDLARMLSLAAHIDVALVRTLRIRRLAGGDVSTEADLWSSALVEARGEGELVLRSDVREALWNELRAEREALRGNWVALTEARGEATPLVQLEERLTFLALDGDLAAIDRELRTVIAAMRDEPDRRRNLAAWSAQALDHLPAEVRQTEAARILGNVARSWVATPLQIAAMTPAVDSMELVQALQPDTAPRATLYLRRVGDTLEVTIDPGHLRSERSGGGFFARVLTAGWAEILGFPTSNPVLIIDHDRPYQLDLRGVTRIPVRGPRVMIGTPDKRRWWLEHEPPRPSIGSFYAFTLKADAEVADHVAYLVAPDRLVTAARWLADSTKRAQNMSFGDHRWPAEFVAIDEDADIALLQLRASATEPPLELDPEVRQGQAWQAFSSGARIVGTVATAGPSITIRVPPHVTIPLPPGTPIFSGTKVIGHVGSEPMRDGVLHTVSARLIQWWLDQPSAHAEAVSPGPLTVENVERMRYLLVFAGTASWMHPLPPSGEVIIGRSEEADLRIDNSAVARRHARLLLDDDMVTISDLGSHNGTYVNNVRIADSHVLSPNDAIRIHNATLVFHVGSTGSREQGQSASAAHVPNVAPEQTAPREPLVWLQAKRPADLPRELTLEIGPEAAIDDLVVVFVGDDDRQRPAAVYRVTERKDLPNFVNVSGFGDLPAPPGAEIRATLVVDLPPPPDALLRSNQREIASFAGVTTQRDTRALGIHDGLIDLLWRLQSIEEVLVKTNMNRERAAARDELRQLFGPPPLESVATLPVVIELPATISTDGLLGTALAHDGDLRRFRRYRWGMHEVAIATDDSPAPPSRRAIRVKIHEVEADPRHEANEFIARVFRNPGKDAFFAACETTSRWLSAELIVEPASRAPGGYDLEIVVHRVPKVAPTHALRRGIQLVIAILDVLDHGPPLSVAALHVPGCGGLDLVEAQRRALSLDDEFSVLWLDPDTDLIVVCNERNELIQDPWPAYRRLAAALGGVIADRFPLFGGLDPIAGRFGVARERSARRIDSSDDDPARVSVRSTDGSPVRGHVAFYTALRTTAGEVAPGLAMTRVRAIDGVASCELPHRTTSYAVGAVIEDEGIVLESYIAPPKHYEVFLTYPSSARETAQRLYDLLRFEVHTFNAVFTSLIQLPGRPGEGWDDQVRAVQRQARVTVALVPPDVPPTWFLDEEILTALALHRTAPEAHALCVVLLGPIAYVPRGLDQVGTIAATSAGGLHDVVAHLRKLLAQTRRAVRAPEPPTIPTGRDADHVRLYTRLVRLTDSMFEQIVVEADIDPGLIAPASAAVAHRAVDVAQLAALDRELYRRVAATLDSRAPQRPPQGPRGAP